MVNKTEPQKWIYTLYTCMTKLQDENRTIVKDLDKEALKQEITFQETYIFPNLESKYIEFRNVYNY